MNLQLDKGGLKGEERGFIAGRSLYVCICLLMAILGYTFRGMQNEIASMNLPWYDEPLHITQPYTEHIRRYLKNTWILCWKGWPHSLCIKEAGWEKGILTRDSSGVSLHVGARRYASAHLSYA